MNIVLRMGRTPGVGSVGWLAGLVMVGGVESVAMVSANGRHTYQGTSLSFVHYKSS